MLIAIYSTPAIPSSIIRLTALFPPPPTPTTIIFAANSAFPDFISNKAAPPSSCFYSFIIIYFYPILYNTHLPANNQENICSFFRIFGVPFRTKRTSALRKNFLSFFLCFLFLLLRFAFQYYFIAFPKIFHMYRPT